MFGAAMRCQQVDVPAADRDHAGRCALECCDMLKDSGARRYIPA